MSVEAGSAEEDLLDEIEEKARQVLGSGRWSSERNAELDEAFERAARRALRAPVLGERSLRLRRLAKLLVPERLRSIARRAVGMLDASSRALFARRSRPAGRRH